MRFSRPFFAVLGVLGLAAVAAAAGGMLGADPSAPLGLGFGLKVKEARRALEQVGVGVIDDGVDSQKIHTLLVEGALVKLPPDTQGFDVTTRFEFWKKKLYSATLLLKSETPERHRQVAAALKEFIVSSYGPPKEEDSFLGFSTWTWLHENLKVVLSTNPSYTTTSVEYIYIPLARRRELEKYEKLLGTPPPDPIKEHFLQ